MVLWRISRHRDLSGTGGLKASGRWHYAGHPIIYLTENPAAALLEVCVHTSANDVPPDFTLLKIEGPEIKIPTIALEDLSRDWPEHIEQTRKPGTEWLRQNASVLLKVPSVIVPETFNFLFNPTHAEAARFRIIETFAYSFDIRSKA